MDTTLAIAEKWIQSCEQEQPRLHDQQEQYVEEIVDPFSKVEKRPQELGAKWQVAMCEMQAILAAQLAVVKKHQVLFYQSMFLFLIGDDGTPA